MKSPPPTFSPPPHPRDSKLEGHLAEPTEINWKAGLFSICWLPSDSLAEKTPPPFLYSPAQGDDQSLGKLNRTNG